MIILGVEMRDTIDLKNEKILILERDDKMLMTEGNNDDNDRKGGQDTNY